MCDYILLWSRLIRLDALTHDDALYLLYELRNWYRILLRVLFYWILWFSIDFQQILLFKHLIFIWRFHYDFLSLKGYFFQIIIKHLLINIRRLGVVPSPNAHDWWRVKLQSFCLNSRLTNQKGSSQKTFNQVECLSKRKKIIFLPLWKNIITILFAQSIWINIWNSSVKCILLSW